MQVTCSCGKVLNVPENLAGKSGRCPACKKIFQMPGAPPAVPLPSRITVTCSCGKKLAAPATAAGKKVLCPKCSKELTVPGGAAKPSSVAAGGSKRSAPVITPMPPPASYASSAPTAPRRPAPAPREDLTFDVEAAPPEPPKPALLPADSAGGHAEREEYGLSKPKCPNCKADMPRGAQFCVECGTALATGAKIHGAAAPTAKTKKLIQIDPEDRKKLIYGVIGLILLGLLIWYVNKPKGMTAAEQRAAAQAVKGPPGMAPKTRVGSE